MNEIVKIRNKEEFEKVIKNNKTVVVKATAEWCGPCRALENTLKGLNKGDLDGAILAEFDVDDAEDVSRYLGVRNIPVLFFYKDGEQKDKLLGNVASNNIYGAIKKL